MEKGIRDHRICILNATRKRETTKTTKIGGKYYVDDKLANKKLPLKVNRKVLVDPLDSILPGFSKILSGF
jgi:hypothetical protein